MDLAFRGFAGRSDYVRMAKLLQDIAIAESADFWLTPQDIEHDYQYLVNSKPETDMVMVEDAQGDLAALPPVHTPNSSCSPALGRGQGVGIAGLYDFVKP